MTDDQSPLDDFLGTARVFPLPNLVVFPKVVQPLHIFEQRYRDMTRDALRDDRLIALALLQPGWEPDYEDKPAIYPVVCVTRIIAEQKLDDGRYNLLVRGLGRARITRELETDDFYRSADMDLLEEIHMTDLQAGNNIRQEFAELIPKWFPGPAKVREQFDKLIRSEMNLGSLCDVLSFALPLPLAVKQLLLEELDEYCRAQALLERLRGKKGKNFPPDFSLN